MQSLTEELAELARETARLLLTPRYDEAELAELDVRAREVRQAIRSALAPQEENCREPVIVHTSRLVSGG